MDELDQLQWVNKNLGSAISVACKGSTYEPDLWAALTVRETGVLIARTAPKIMSLKMISALMTGDYIKRKGETTLTAHGYGFVQFDVDSFPEWIATGDWKDPYKLYAFAVKVMGAKRKYIVAHAPHPLSTEDLDRANVSAWNCGEGNVVKCLVNDWDVDKFTANHNYSADVWRLRALFRSKILNQE